MSASPKSKTYLGDGAYVDFDGYGLTLTAENGIEATDTIYLEPEAWLSLVAFVARIKAEQGVKTEADHG